MPGVIATQAVGRVVEGEAAIEQHQVGLLQALGQLLRAEQLGDGHTELLWWCGGWIYLICSLPMRSLFRLPR